MPELPEVETIRRGLELAIVGQTIEGVEVLWEKSFPLAERAVGQRIEHVGRRAKVLIWELSGGDSLLFHLKMTGQMVLVKSDGERFAGGHPTDSMAAGLPDKSTRVIFTFKNDDQLFFNDQRKFGWIKLMKSSEVGSDALISRLGPEPDSPLFSAEHLASVIRRHPRAPIKAIILDQSTVSGVGNIYADESLHLARIHPARRGGELKPAEIKRLHAAIKEIIVLGIEHGGTSFTNYVNALGQKGDYLLHARVFRRQGEPCPVCGSIIEKIRVAGRGTHVCPRCQPKPRP